MTITVRRVLDYRHGLCTQSRRSLPSAWPRRSRTELLAGTSLVHSNRRAESSTRRGHSPKHQPVPASSVSVNGSAFRSVLDEVLAGRFEATYLVELSLAAPLCLDEFSVAGRTGEQMQ